MEEHQQLIERLTAFYREAGNEAPSSVPAWRLESGRKTAWLQPVLASAALAVLAVGSVIGLRLAREHASSAVVKPTPSASLSASATPSAVSSPIPLSNWVTRRVPLDGQLYYGMALDTTGIFALYTPTSADPHDSSKTMLARIDRASGKITTAGPFPGGFQLLRVGAGLWVVGGLNGGPTVDRYWMDLVDPLTLQIKSRNWVPGTAGPDFFSTPELAGTADQLWLGYGQRLYRLDPATGRALSTIPLSQTVSSVSLDPAGQRLYVGVQPASGQSEAQVLEFSAATGARLASASTGGAGLGGPQVAASADGVWIAYATGMMGAVEHRRAASLSAFPIPSQFGHTNGIGVVVGAGRVWLVDGGAQRVSCVDPRTGTIAASATLPFPTALVTDAGGTYAAVQNEVDFLEPTSCP